MIIINEKKKYRELKESIRMINSQRSDAEKINLTEEGEIIGINEVIKRNETLNIVFTCFKGTSIKATYKNEIILLFIVQKRCTKYKFKSF